MMRAIGRGAKRGHGLFALAVVTVLAADPLLVEAQQIQLPPRRQRQPRRQLRHPPRRRPELSLNSRPKTACSPAKNSKSCSRPSRSIPIPC